MLEKVSKVIRKHHMLVGGEHVLIGLSGGADSVALLHVLLDLCGEYPVRISAVHVNHGLRGAEAGRDEQFVRELCERKSIPLKVYAYDINREAESLKLTNEEAGRVMRYKSFAEEAAKVGADKIAVAHNMNDNAETLLMRMIRGTGLTGLRGIPPVRGDIIRPLIECRRAEIEEYCSEKNIEYMDDTTNFENIYARNKIRLNIIPYIEKELNEGVVETLSRMSGLISEENGFLELLASEGYEKCAAGDGLLSIEELKKYHDVIKRRIIRRGFQKYSSDLRDLSYEHVGSVIELLNKPTGKSVNLPVGLCAEVQYGNLRLYKKEGTETGFSYEIDFNRPVYIPELQKHCGLYKKNFDMEGAITYNLDYANVKNGLCLRTRRPGDKIYIKNIEGTKKINSYFIDEKIPRQLRERIPLLADGGEIIMIMDTKGIFSDRYKAGANTNATDIAYLKIWRGRSERNHIDVNNRR